jgi:hypothetical protein
MKIVHWRTLVAIRWTGHRDPVLRLMPGTDPTA